MASKSNLDTKIRTEIPFLIMKTENLSGKKRSLLCQNSVSAARNQMTRSNRQSFFFSDQRGIEMNPLAQSWTNWHLIGNNQLVEQ